MGSSGSLKPYIQASFGIGLISLSFLARGEFAGLLLYGNRLKPDHLFNNPVYQLFSFKIEVTDRGFVCKQTELLVGYIDALRIQ